MNDRTRILVLLENESYPHDRRLRLEAESLTEAGYEVTVICPTDVGSEAAEAELAGVRVLRYPQPAGGNSALGYLREYALSLLRMRRIVRRVAAEAPPDLVMLCNPPDLLIFVVLGLKRRGAGVVFDHHDLSPELFERKFGRRGLLRRLLVAAERFTYRNSDAVIEPNDSYAENARARGGVAPDRLFVVRHGPDTERFFPVEPEPELRRDRERLVLWIGTLNGTERVAGLIDAAQELRRRGRRDVGFTLVGSGSAFDAVQREVRSRGLDGVVALPGRADDDLLRAYMSTADVCVSVDRSNVMNESSTVTKVLDYMTMGCAVVQFPLREMQRVCGDTTLYARDGDVGGLADQIERLLDDPAEARRLGDAARERLLGHLTWADQVPGLLAAVERARPGRG